MNTELENKLYQIDPIFFEHAIACKEGKQNQMNTCMYFGCECGDGWFEPLKRFVKKSSILNNLAKQYNAKFVCDQLKQKFGQLRIYYSAKSIDESKKQDYNDFSIISSMFEQAVKACENECWNVCEWCGADGGRDGENLITTRGWISRICKKCAKEKAEKETKHYDEINKQEYIPRITWFQEGYQFLNVFHIDGFSYKDEKTMVEGYYNSIVQAFYSIKDPIHKQVYNSIGKEDSNKNSSHLIKKIANSFGYKYQNTQYDYELLKNIVKAKFSYKYNKQLLLEFLQTEGKKLFNMGNHHDNILGYCTCEKCKDLQHNDIYAKILTEVREQLYEKNRNISLGDVGYKDHTYYIYGDSDVSTGKKHDWREISALQVYKYMQKNNITEEDIKIIL